MKGRVLLIAALVASAPWLAAEGPSVLPIRAEPEALDVGLAVELSLKRSPDLLDALDLLKSSEVNLVGVRSQYMPQVNPYFNRVARDDSSAPASAFGVTLSQQFAFGPLVTGRVDTLSMGASPDAYASRYAVAVEQPLLRGLDPALTRDPLRQAERGREIQGRQVELQRRQTVVTVWRAYLNVALSDELVNISTERVGRAAHLVAASEARMKAGTLSRLDVLRSQQLLAGARLQLNQAVAAVGDAHESLARLTGRPPGTRFAVTAPKELPVSLPDKAAAISFARSNRIEILEQRSRVQDVEIAVRIARSNVLPSLNVFASWSALGVSPTVAGAFVSPGTPSYSVGFRSLVTANVGQLLAQKTQAEIALAGARRNLTVLEEDVVRAVEQSDRQLRAAEERARIEEVNLEVAQTQLEVANLRFEKGFIDNFQVIDSEEAYNSTRVSALASGHDVLLGRLDFLLTSGLLAPGDFCNVGDGAR